MKYTKYILYGNSVNTSELGPIAIPAMLMGIPILTGFLCGAIIMDSNRYIKLKYLLFKREQRNLNYIKCVLRSLDVVPTNQLVNYLLPQSDGLGFRSQHSNQCRQFVLIFKSVSPRQNIF